MNKKNIILSQLKESDYGLTQKELVGKLMKKLDYVSEQSCRVSFSRMLNEMKNSGSVSYNEKKSPKGSIKTKIWFVK